MFIPNLVEISMYVDENSVTGSAQLIAPFALQLYANNQKKPSSRESRHFDKHSTSRFPSVTEKERLLPLQNDHPSDGLINWNGVPKMPRFGPASFYQVIAFPYYARSPVDGSRNYQIGSSLHNLHCKSSPYKESPIRHHEESLANHLKQYDAKLILPDDVLCSSGPRKIWPFQDFAEDTVSAYEFENVCATLNLDSSKHVQRGLVYFDALNNAPRRCVPCPNPLMFSKWGDHACGIMWTHQINAKSIGDLQTCYNANKAEIRSISQRQAILEDFPLDDRLVGVLYPGRTLLLSFAYSNPGQCVTFFFQLHFIINFTTTSLTLPKKYTKSTFRRHSHLAPSYSSLRQRN